MIYRSRKRPRKTSASFRTLWWLIGRVAAWNLIYPNCDPQQYPRATLSYLRLTHRDIAGMVRWERLHRYLKRSS